MKPKTYLRLSSNATLFWKIFVPTFWFTFYGALLISIWAADPRNLGIFAGPGWKIGITTFFILGTLLLYFTAMRLYRVEYEEGHFFVSNYIRTIKIPVELIDRILLDRGLVWRIGNLQTSKKTLLGKRFTFLFRKSQIEKVTKEFPALLEVGGE